MKLGKLLFYFLKYEIFEKAVGNNTKILEKVGKACWSHPLFFLFFLKSLLGFGKWTFINVQNGKTF